MRLCLRDLSAVPKADIKKHLGMDKEKAMVHSEDAWMKRMNWQLLKCERSGAGCLRWAEDKLPAERLKKPFSCSRWPTKYLSKDANIFAHANFIFFLF